MKYTPEEQKRLKRIANIVDADEIDRIQDAVDRRLAGEELEQILERAARRVGDEHERDPG